MWAYKKRELGKIFMSEFCSFFLCSKVLSMWTGISACVTVCVWLSVPHSFHFSPYHLPSRLHALLPLLLFMLTLNHGYDILKPKYKSRESERIQLEINFPQHQPSGQKKNCLVASAALLDAKHSLREAG